MGIIPRPTIIDTNYSGNCIIWIYILAYIYMPLSMIPVSFFFRYCWIYRIPFFYFFGINAIRLYYQHWLITPEQLGRACIANIYYFDDDVHKKYAPYFGFDELKEDYERLSWNIPDYNFWDFAVTMNKMYADHIDVVGKWSKNKDTTRKRISELAISFLCDESTNHPTDKIWWYMNS